MNGLPENTQLTLLKPVPSEPPDPTVDLLAILQEALARGRALRENGAPFWASDLEQIQAILEDLPLDFYPGHVFAALPELQPESLLYGLVSSCPELELPDYRRVRVIWRVKAQTRLERTVLGNCRLIPKKDRQLAQQYAQPGELLPWWEVQLALDVWCLSTESERTQILHHEALHCGLKPSGDPCLRPHDIEEFGASMLRFGPLDESRVRALAMGLRHRAGKAAVNAWVPGVADTELLPLWHQGGGDS